MNYTTIRKKTSATDGIDRRKDLKHYYENKYYNLFMNAYKWTGLTREEHEFVMRQFWHAGTIACFPVKELDGVLIFTPYAPVMFNLYDAPTQVTLVNKRGVPFIPAGIQEVDKDVVLGYIQRNKKSIRAVLDYYIETLVETDLTIWQTLNTLKVPFVLTTTPENEDKIKALFDTLMSGAPTLVLSAEDVKNISALSLAQQDHLNELYAYKCAIENELKEFLGIENLGVNEKKEHLITAEIGANDEVTENNKNVFLDCLKEFCDKIQKVFNITITVESNAPEPEQVEEPAEERGENDNV